MSVNCREERSWGARERVVHTHKCLCVCVSVKGTVDPVLSRGSDRFAVPRRRLIYTEIRVSLRYCNKSSAHIYWCGALLLMATPLAAWVDGFLATSKRKDFLHDCSYVLLFTLQ